MIGLSTIKSPLKKTTIGDCYQKGVFSGKTGTDWWGKPYISGDYLLAYESGVRDGKNSVSQDIKNASLQNKLQIKPTDNHG